MSSLFKSVASGILLCVISFSVAAGMPPKPTTCPTVQSLMSSGLPYIEYDDGSYIAYQLGQYTPHEIWGFLIAGIQANSSQEASRIAYAQLSTLSGTPEPVALTDINVWACFYSVQSSDLLAVAFTPVDMSVKLSRSLRAYR